jgi:hypothetical protein
MNKSVLIDLGTVASSGEPFNADLATILRSNLLVRAASGGGKSKTLPPGNFFALGRGLFNALSKLRTLELIKGARGEDLQIADVFLEDNFG